MELTITEQRNLKAIAKLFNAQQNNNGYFIGNDYIFACPANADTAVKNENINIISIAVLDDSHYCCTFKTLIQNKERINELDISMAERELQDLIRHQLLSDKIIDGNHEYFQHITEIESKLQPLEYMPGGFVL